MALVKIFNENDKDFTANGMKIIQPVKCIIHEEDNGEYYCELECNIEDAQYLQSNNILVVNGQGFRLANPETKNSKLHFKAYHVSYDAKTMWCRMLIPKGTVSMN